MTEVTYYRWRNEYGGVKGDQVKRLKELEAENTRLRRAVSDATLDKLILKEAAPGKLPSPARRPDHPPYNIHLFSVALVGQIFRSELARLTQNGR